MSALHIVFSAQGCDRVRALSSDDDRIVLMGDAVYESFDAAYALDDDVTARGLSRANQVSYAELVELSVKHDKVVSWP